MTEKKRNCPDKNAVTVIAPARLHMGFFDMNGDLGRKFGSAGLCLSDISTKLTATKDDNGISAIGPDAQQAEGYARAISAHLNLDKGVEIRVDQAIPRHIGLGSGTQMSLAIGAAITRLFNKPIDMQEIAKLFHRGIRSGIGIGTFSLGGFIVDGGLDKLTDIPPVIARAPFPEQWRILLVFDDKIQGLSGEDEYKAFTDLPLMQADTSAAICRHTLMQLLPALHECNCEKFGHSVSFIQDRVSDYFKPAQGERYCSPFMEQVLGMLKSFGASGTGQSSWGPTGFACYPNEALASQALHKIQEEWRHQPRLKFALCRGQNTPAEITQH